MSKHDTAAAVLAALRFDAAGLVPAIAQQHDTGEVLMLAWMNREAVAETIATGQVCYFSRSRGKLWRKGESSGQVQRLVELRIDCDGDALLLQVDQHGVACHTGRRSCFFRAVRDGAVQEIMAPEVDEAVLYGGAAADHAPAASAASGAPAFPEVRESDADPATAAIYADIRAASGQPLVNLIWRHFAALPGVLPWAWGAVAPLVRSAGMAEARRRIAAVVPLPSLPVPDTAAWRAAGLGPDDQRRVAAIVAAYTRGNVTNLMALTALRLRLLAPGDRPARPLTDAWGRPADPGGSSDIPPLDPLPRMAALDPATAALVRALAGYHAGAGGGVVPSLYLHLSHWPGLLRVLPDWLDPLLAPAALRAAREGAIAFAEQEAIALLPAPIEPPPGTRERVTAALDRFAGKIIPDLVPVCLALGPMLRSAG
ncbi:MAG: phosphoribosyl-AMP cyclohydrolase [Rhodospirillales bacterium]|nr:phosphoribosyl-AMP cyclohydrolase [Rhodospirillales bacterium]